MFDNIWKQDPTCGSCSNPIIGRQQKYINCELRPESDEMSPENCHSYSTIPLYPDIHVQYNHVFSTSNPGLIQMFVVYGTRVTAWTIFRIELAVENAAINLAFGGFSFYMFLPPIMKNRRVFLIRFTTSSRVISCQGMSPSFRSFCWSFWWSRLAHPNDLI